MKKFQETITKTYQIKLPEQRDLKNAFECYKTSIETEMQESEHGRRLYAEVLNENQEKLRPDLLSELSLTKYTENFKKGKPDPRISCDSSNLFGIKMNTELPLTDLLDFDVKCPIVIK